MPSMYGQNSNASQTWTFFEANTNPVECPSRLGSMVDDPNEYTPEI